MAKPILVANWKNQPGSLAEARALLTQLSRNSKIYKKLSLFIAPPLPYLELVSRYSRNFARLASQDIPSEFQGTQTGEIAPDILKSFGTRLSIIGHSERRAVGETNELVSRKIKVALRSNITPLVSVGEKTPDTDGEHFEFLRQQLKASLAGLTRQAVSRVAIAYEPAWAIGKTAKGAMVPIDLSESVMFIKKILADMFGRRVAERVPILYGGSVEPSNAFALAHETGIKGFLVGHSSLDHKSFKAIAESLISK
ncbi:MAG: triose-phosphate isomerase family protein [Parcubacteria group bacterium]